LRVSFLMNIDYTYDYGYGLIMAGIF